MELKLAKLLQRGVLISGLMLLVGWMSSFELNHNPFNNLKIYHHISLIKGLEIAFMLEEWGRLLSFLGLGVLITLPTLRVMMTIMLFIKDNEKTMAAVASLVFLGLIYSFGLGLITT
jgi:uncharacterized membrane protein